jgi:MFS superfamily sulfate permease-like transporter
VLCIAAVIISTMGKFSLVCAIIIGIVVNYVNFYAFSKIITLRNSGVLEMIADEAEAHG